VNKRKRTRDHCCGRDYCSSIRGPKRPFAQPPPVGGPLTGIPPALLFGGPTVAPPPPPPPPRPPVLPLAAPLVPASAPAPYLLSLPYQLAQQNLNRQFGGLPVGQFLILLDSHVKFYVNIAEIGRFLDTFHPDILPPPSLMPRNTGRSFVVIFPWYTRRMWGIFPFMTSLVRSQRLQVGEVWAINLALAGEIDSWSANLSLSIRFNRLTASIHGDVFSTNYPTNR
jgi:hypothetical protein